MNSPLRGLARYAAPPLPRPPRPRNGGMLLDNGSTGYIWDWILREFSTRTESVSIVVKDLEMLCLVLTWLASDNAGGWLTREKQIIDIAKNSTSMENNGFSY